MAYLKCLIYTAAFKVTSRIHLQSREEQYILHSAYF